MSLGRKRLLMICFHPSAAVILAVLVILVGLQPDERYFKFGYILIPREGQQIDVRRIGTIYSPSIVHTYYYAPLINLCGVYLLIWYVTVLRRALARQAKMPPELHPAPRYAGLSRGAWGLVVLLGSPIALLLLAAGGQTGDLVAVVAGIMFPLCCLGGLVAKILQTMSRDRTKPGCCRHCGYDLRATPSRCPECGEVPMASSGEVAG